MFCSDICSTLAGIALIDPGMFYGVVGNGLQDSHEAFLIAPSLLEAEDFLFPDVTGECPDSIHIGKRRVWVRRGAYLLVPNYKFAVNASSMLRSGRAKKGIVMQATLKIALLASLSVMVAAPAMAAETIVNTVVPLPSATTWGTLPGETTGNIAVTDTVARSGNGSLELTGDRTRAQLGVQYAGALKTTLGALNDVSSLTFDWRIAGDSVSALSPFLTPALRLLFNDGAGVRKELIWEGAYNGTYDNTSFDTWYTSGVDDKFYITGGNVNAGQTIAQWASQLTGATVSGFSVGDGSSAGSGYHAFADNVTFNMGGTSTTYNFETAAVNGAVPELATWAMMLVGFGGIGFAMRRRSKIRTTVSYA